MHMESAIGMRRVRGRHDVDVVKFSGCMSGAVAQLGARLDGIEEVVGSNPIGSTNVVLYSPET